MKVISSTPFGAKGCAVTGRSADVEGFIEALSPILGHPIYISATAVKVMGDEFGMVPRDEANAQRFERHALEQENAELRQALRDQELLEEELAEAKATIRESDEIHATLDALADQGLTTKQVKGILDRFARLREDLGGAEDTVTDLLDTVTRIAALKDGRKKVTA